MLAYRDRISLLTAMTGIVLALQPILITPRYVFTWYPFGTPLSVTVGPAFWLGVLLFLTVVPGTQWVMAAWDVPHLPRFVEGAWTLPLAISWIALRLFPYQGTLRAWVALLFTSLLLLALTWHSLVDLLGGVRSQFPASFVLRTLVFATAGTLYLWLYTVGERGLLSATQMLVGSYLLAAAFWEDLPVSVSLRWQYSAVVGLVVGQMAWVFLHTTLPPLRAGLLLLLLFYALVLIFERDMQRRLSLRFLGEVAFTSMVALILIVIFPPFR